MKAAPERQLRLLDLQALDTRLGQLAHARATLPEHAQLVEVVREATALDADLVRARTAVSDLEREVARAEADVQQVRDRAARDRARLDSGTGTAKDLQALQHELASLARRQGDLEEVELEVMERAEAAEAALADVESQRAEVGDRMRALEAARDRRLAELSAEESQVVAPRPGLVVAVGEDLLALYDKVRLTSGTGAAALSRRRCLGCQLELHQVDLDRIRSAADDEVLRCEECRRILVRTPESGL